MSAARKEIGQIMVVNDTPNEECRIAILQEGKLEALFMEREASATQVGNIYKGRVTNVEPAIQAAFVDFGESQAGFLHISDLHPRYFPKGDGKERVGKKTPRRDRPMMQEALRRGDEVLVQVLKQGLGTKGPTLTSYLSIPGRLLVMMPGMDRSGVSRKVEDEELRRTMRKILDSLSLPEGFGFILRTAGFDRTKTELQRDAAYLTRLWKVMERRIESVGAPCALYTESDLLIRTIRDVVDATVTTIVVDSPSAFSRARGFLEVVAPRSAPRVLYYDRAIPIFHAFDVERQIELTHAREVPLPSGGALVVDQTEALVAIDVNSGRSRSARDSETNAFQTNCEAVEEISRQLRLRDLGGVIVNDLIDMRSQKHRREIEERFRAALKRDRARTTITTISEFGILEMTRQRMRPSLRKAHYIDCPHCAGHGEIKMQDSVASDAMRQMGFLLDFERVRRIEMVCSSRVASVLLSTKRRAIDRLEDRTGKRIDVRISDAIPVDRVDLYAYDERNADIDVEKLPRPQMPKLDSLLEDLPASRVTVPLEEESTTADDNGGRRRRRRRRRPGPADATAIAMAGGFDDDYDEDEPSALDAINAAEEAAERAEAEATAKAPARSSDEQPGEAADDGRRRRRRRRRRRKGGEGSENGAVTAGSEDDLESAAGPLDESDDDRDGAELDAVVATPVVVDDRPRRIHELAKDLGVTSKEIIARCGELEGVEVKSHSSSVSPEIAAVIRAWYAPPPPPPPPPPAPRVARTPRVDGAAQPAPAPVDSSSAEVSEEEGGRRRRRRRRRRGGKGDERGAAAAPNGRPDLRSGASAEAEAVSRPESAPTSAPELGPESTSAPKLNARPDLKSAPRGASSSSRDARIERDRTGDEPRDPQRGEAEGKSRRGRRRGKRGGGGDGASDSGAAPKPRESAKPATAAPAPVTAATTPAPSAAAPAVAPIRALYRAGRSKKVSATAKAEAMRKESSLP